MTRGQGAPTGLTGTPFPDGGQAGGVWGNVVREILTLALLLICGVISSRLPVSGSVPIWEVVAGGGVLGHLGVRGL